MDFGLLNLPAARSGLWLLLAAVVIVVWSVGRGRPLLRRFGGALWCLVVAIVVEAAMPWLSDRPARIAYVLALAALSFAVVRGIVVTADHVVRRRQTHFSTILRDLTTLLVYTIVIVAVLHSIEVDVSALLTTSAIVTAVIGLALQETLGNVFSGLSLQLQKPFEPGDWIRFDSFEGRVQGIGWRSTKVVTRNLETLDVPNGFLAREVVTNARGSGIGDELFVRVTYDRPPNEVKEVILSVLHEVPEVVATPPAVVEVVEYGEFAIRYRIRFWMRDYGHQPRVRDAIMSKLWYAFRRHDIRIPFPIRTVHMHDMTAERGPTDDRRRELFRELRQVDFLAELSDDDLAMLGSALTSVVFGTDEIICREGGPGDAFFVLHRGEVEVVAHGAGGQETHVANLCAPAFFGEMALMTGEPRAATVRAKGDAEILVIDRAGFEQLFKIHPSVAAAVSRVLATRQTELRERREQTVTPESTESRARRLLTKMQTIFRF